MEKRKHAKKPKKPGIFPYLATSPEHQLAINREISQLLDSIDSMLYDLARHRLRGIADEDTVQEMVQECRHWLWQRSLPKFNAALGFKVSTFIHKCAMNYFHQEVRSMKRRRQSHKRTILVDPELLFDVLPCDGGYLEEKILALADEVNAHPEKIMTESQVRVFRTVTDNPHIPMKDLAHQLGYKRASSLSMMMRRIRERVTEIDLEEYVPPPQR